MGFRLPLTGVLKDMERRIYQFFAEMLEYPQPDLRVSVREGLFCLEPLYPGIADLLKAFASYVRSTPMEEVEEVYTRTFDLQPLCAPYVGYHLLGEDHRRSFFMARLKEYYAKCGFAIGKELPDHLSLILRFLSLRGDGDKERELVTECVTPAVAKMVSRLPEEENPYKQVLRALLLLLQEKIPVQKRGTE